MVRNNIGGSWIKADSVGSATSLKAVINNNLFADSRVKTALKIEGRRSSPYQDVVLYRNYFAKNFNRFENVIVLNQVCEIRLSLRAFLCILVGGGGRYGLAR